jgi:hypothetical protein
MFLWTEGVYTFLYFYDITDSIFPCNARAEAEAGSDVNLLVISAAA